MANTYRTALPLFYQIVVRGQESWGTPDERTRLTGQLTARFRLSARGAGELLDRAAAVVMKNLPWEQAVSRQKDLERLGLKAHLLPMGADVGAPPADEGRYRLVVQTRGAWTCEQSKHKLAQKLVSAYKVPPLAALQLLDSDAFVVGATATLEDAREQAHRLEKLGLPVRISSPEAPLFPGLADLPWRRWLPRGCLMLVTAAALIGLCLQIPKLIEIAVVRPERARAWGFQAKLKRFRALRDARWAAAYQHVRFDLTPRLTAGEHASLTIYNHSRKPASITFRVFDQGKWRTFRTMVPPGRARVQRWPYATAGRKQVEVIYNNSRKFMRLLGALVTLRPAMVPIALPKGVQLSKDPRDWKILVNLYWYPPYQWQYSSVIHKGQEIQRFLISSGAWPKPTPLGEFTIVTQLWSAVSTIYHSVMPFWNGLSSPIWGSGAFGLHALQGSGYMYALGSPASHGCVRHSPSAARWIMENVPLQTRVTIMSRRDYVEPPPQPANPKPRRYRRWWR